MWPLYPRLESTSRVKYGNILGKKGDGNESFCIQVLNYGERVAKTKPPQWPLDQGKYELLA